MPKEGDEIVEVSEEVKKEIEQAANLLTECAIANKIKRISIVMACFNIISGIVEQVDGDIEDHIKTLRHIHKERAK